MSQQLLDELDQTEVPLEGTDLEDDEFLQYAETGQSAQAASLGPFKNFHSSIYPYIFIDLETAAALSKFSIRHFRRIVVEDHLRIIQINRRFFLMAVDLERWIDSSAYRSRKNDQDKKLKRLSDPERESLREVITEVFGQDPFAEPDKKQRKEKNAYDALAIFVYILMKDRKFKARELVPVTKRSISLMHQLNSRVVKDLKTNGELSHKAGAVRLILGKINQGGNADTSQIANPVAEMHRVVDNRLL